MKPLSVDTWGEEEKEAIYRVVRSGQFTMGKTTELFEHAYADYCGTKYCVAVNSGSSANLLMVAAWTLRHKPGIVVVPAIGWSTSYSPFQQYGWTLRFVDIDRYTLNIDTNELSMACEKDDVDLILSINLLGNPCEYERFPAGIPVLEDNCESMGARYRSRSTHPWKVTGSFGVMSSHSTFFSHHICTMEGGMITTDDEYFYHMLLSLRSHGWTRHLPAKNVFNVKPGKFDFILPGYNVRPTEMQCAIGIEQLKKLPSFIEQRRDNADRFPYLKQAECGESSWFGFAVFDDDVNQVIDKYESRPIVTGNFLRQKAIKYYRHQVFGEMKNANYIHDNAVMIGNSHKMIDW